VWPPDTFNLFFHVTYGLNTHNVLINNNIVMVISKIGSIQYPTPSFLKQFLLQR
jgi:hypothetical protein